MSVDDTQKVSRKHPSRREIEIRVNDEPVQISDDTPTGRQILAAAGLRPDTEFALLIWPSAGPTQEIGLDEVVPIRRDDDDAVDFFATKSDHVAYFVLDDERYAWAGRLDLAIIRRIGRVPAGLGIWLERRDEPDLLLEEGQTVDLRPAGVERLYSRQKVWGLNVQGDLTEWDSPHVLVRDALLKAGVDLSKQWMIVLKVKEQEPRQVALDDVVDLDQPGIERLWLRPRQVDNGEGQALRRDFSLLPKDDGFLAASNYRWETITAGARRWLLIHNYLLPKGYNAGTCRLAFEVPATYPAAQIDMFYCDPPLSVLGGAAPPATDVRETIDGVSFQRWSRHRCADNPWSPSRDSISTHLGLVDESLGREVGA